MRRNLRRPSFAKSLVRAEIISIISRLINGCWTLFTWSIGLAVVIALVVFGYYYLRLDDEVRRQAEQILARHYSDLHVEVGSAQFLQGRGIKLYEVEISAPRPTGELQPLLVIDEAFLKCPTDWEDLIAAQLRLERIVAKRVVMHVIRETGGNWSVQPLWPPPVLGDSPPTIEVVDATFLIRDQRTASPVSQPIAGVDLTLTPETSTQRRSYLVAATMSGGLAKHARLEGRLSPDDGGVDLQADIRDLEVTPELVSTLATVGLSEVPEVELHGLASGSLQLNRAAGDANRPNVSCEFTLEEGRCTCPHLPQPLTELTVRGRCDQSGLKLEQVTGKCGTAELQLACERSGWGAQAPLGLRAKVGRMPLDRALYDVLPERLQATWNRYEPTGFVDADISLVYDGRQWVPQLTLACHQLGITENKHFPYRLEQGSGTVTLTKSADQAGGELSLDLVGMGQSRPIQLVGRLTNIPIGEPSADQSKRAPLGYVEVSGTDLRVHERLIAAMPPKAQNVVRSLQPEGRFDFHWRGERTDPAAKKLDTSLDITLNGCAIQYEHFPYQVRDIHGRLSCRNNTWQFVDLESRKANRELVVTAHGGLAPSPEGNRLQLTIEAQDVELDSDLRQSLKPAIQQLWSRLNPQGRIDFTAVIDHLSHPRQPTRPDIRVGIRPHRNTVSIEPDFLAYPYRLEQLEGLFDYANGQLQMSDVRAKHGRVELATQGTWRPTPGGGWQLRLSELNANYLKANRDLLLALPPRLQDTLDSLQPTGTFSLYDSTIVVTRPPDETARLTSSWNVNLECQQSDLECGVKLEDVSGSVRLAGTSDGIEGYTTGELSLDSLVWNNVQLTQIKGPLWIDQTPAGSIVMLGRNASAKQQEQQQSLRRISARVYGGDLVADVDVRNVGIPRVTLSAALANADLTHFALERLGGRSDVSGKINGQLNLQNTGTSTDAMTGSGELHLVDANIYRLPQIVALLKVLQNRTPDTTAFNRCDSRFTIQGRHINFQELNLLGDAVSLYGSGDTTLSGDQLNLIFRTEMGRRQIPLLSSIMGQAQAQILQLRVDGTLRKPSFHAETLPGVMKTIETIQTELTPAVPPETRQADSRFPWWPFRQ